MEDTPEVAEMEICIHHKGTPCFRDALLEHHLLSSHEENVRAEIAKEVEKLQQYNMFPGSEFAYLRKEDIDTILSKITHKSE